MRRRHLFEQRGSGARHADDEGHPSRVGGDTVQMIKDLLVQATDDGIDGGVELIGIEIAAIGRQPRLAPGIAVGDGGESGVELALGIQGLSQGKQERDPVDGRQLGISGLLFQEH